MSNSTDQDIEERIAFNYFNRIHPISGIYLEKKHNQKPDILIKNRNGILGIEMTELKNFDPINVGIQRRIVKEVQKRLANKYDSSFRVDVLFTSVPISINIKNSIMEYLESIIKDEYYKYVLLEPWKITRIECVEQCEFISCIYYHHYDREKLNMVNFNKIEVDMPEAGYVNTVPEVLLENCIKRKNSKISNYLLNCNECWLYIYVNPMFSEGHFDFSKIKRVGYNSQFTKTIVYSIIEPEKYIEIQ